MTATEPNWRGTLSVPDGPEWYILRELLQGLLHRAYSIDISVRRGRAVLRGRVYSEEVRTSVQNLVALHAPTTGVDNELTWASPLYSADDGENDEEHDWSAASVSMPTGRVDRHPYIRPLETPAAGQRLNMIVDLTAAADAYTKGSFSLQTSSAWSRLDIDVVIDADGIQIPDSQRRKTVALHADGSSSPALFSGKVTATEEVVVRLHFAHEGRDCGYAESRMPVAPSAGPAARSDLPAVLNYMSTDTDWTAPSLTIRIRHDASRRTCHWTFEVAPDLRQDVSADVFGTTELESAKDYFEQQFVECPALAPGRHVQKLRGIGERIWRASPPELHELYASVRKVRGPGFAIQLITDEPYVPWELMFPDDTRVENPAHIFEEHPIARWFTKNGPRVVNFPKGRRVSFVPAYTSFEALPAAQIEAEWLVSRLGAEKGEATYAGLETFLRSPQTAVQLVHFAGHGAAEGQGEHGLRLGYNEWMTAEEINGSVRLGRDHGPFFALNACQVGQTSTALGSVAGWPMALASRGFGGVMAPLWSIEDNEATLFVQSFLEAFMIDGMRLGEAAKLARAKYVSLSANAHAYLFYGDVLARAEP